MYLLDTNVVSEMRKLAKGSCDPQVARWLRDADPAQLFLSVVTVLELEVGYERLSRRDDQQARLVRAWLSDIVYPLFQPRILDIDFETARGCAALHVPDRRPENDALIAATALRHALIVVTRNTADFEGTGARLLNPWIEATL